MKTIKVVAAVIQAFNEKGNPIIFATQRGYGEFKDGWEFPGGKIEPGETPQAALKREILEELDTDIAVGKLIHTIEYNYPEFHLSMDCFWCKILHGDLVLKEHEAARWLTRKQLHDVDWLPADKTIIETIAAALDDRMMHKIGLIGGTGPESTIEYYKGIEYGVQQKSERSFFPNLTIESLSVFEVLDFCGKQDYAGLTDYLLQGIRNLAAAGAQYAALTGITPHIVFDKLSAASPIPLISMIDTARDYAAMHGYKKICLLGTLPTMEGTFFQRSFAKRGIDVVTPNAEEKNYIGSKIETELEFGKVVPETQHTFKAIAERIIREEQVQAVVLGCTELPLIFNGVKLPVPYIDVMQVHIEALVDLIMCNHE